MVLLLLFAMVALVAGMVFYWVKIEDAGETADGGRTPGADPAAGRATAARPETLEGVLVAQLIAGELNRRQYLHAMARLAARDDARHPLAVPPETGTAADA